jgi:hypothetical protein
VDNVFDAKNPRKKNAFDAPPNKTTSCMAPSLAKTNSQWDLRTFV